MLDELDARLVQARALAAAGHAAAAKDVPSASPSTRRTGARSGSATRRRVSCGRSVRASPAPGSAPSGGELTDREHEIMALVAAGRSNRQVADTLFLSEKTVANALTRIYAKVGVRTRAQLARAL